jgi:hypothetical protein
MWSNVQITDRVILNEPTTQASESISILSLISSFIIKYV